MQVVILKIRLIYLFQLAFSLFLLASSFLLQFKLSLYPCPLCIIARLLVFFLAILFFIAYWHNPKYLGQQLYNAVGALFAILGILVTARHLWIIHLPPHQMADCSPGLSYLLQTLSLKGALTVILKSSGECATNNWSVFSLSLPGWAMIAFILLTISSLLAFFLNKKKG